MTRSGAWQPTDAPTRQTTPTCSHGCITWRCRASFWPISESVQDWAGTRPTNTFLEMADLGALLGVREPITTAAALHDWVRHHPEQRVTAEPCCGAIPRLGAAPTLGPGPYGVLLAAAISLVPIRQRFALGLFLPGPITGRLACEPAARVLVGALGWSLGPSPALERARSRLGA